MSSTPEGKAEEPFQQPEPAYQLDWETRAPKRGLLSRLLPSKAGSSTTPALATLPPPATTATAANAAPPPSDSPSQSPSTQDAQAKDTAPGTLPIFHHQTASTTTSEPLRPSLATRLRARYDAILPPHKRYLNGRLRRRPFLLLLTTILAVLILAIGLGAGLSSSRRSSPPEDLPLPGTPKGAGTHSGDLTYYGTGLGACGITSADTDMIVAVSRKMYDAAATRGDTNPNNNPLCGLQIRVFRGENDGKGLNVTVVDRCEACQPTDLDLSPAAFSLLANQDEGRVVGRWRWL